ncbi:MAG TPA: VOC family protein [Terriglobia bacterium]|nr:VOC family protein [Terriglobia bacterium]
MSEQSLPPFHLAIPVRDLAEARAFYGELLGCPEGRSSRDWVDFNFFGHQLVCHLQRTSPEVHSQDTSNMVDDHDVPVPHFGAVLQVPVWESLSKKLKNANVKFVVEPYVRFKGQVGEQATMFFLDPSGNAIEFKAFQNIAGQLFKKA